MTRSIAAAFASAFLCLVATPALAATISIDLPGEAPSTQTQIYSCGGLTLSVDYINATDNSLAVVTMNDRKVVMVNVIAGSGAKYVGQEFVWWTKGADATLYDVTKGENAPGTDCKATG